MTNDELISKGYQLFNLDDHIKPKHSGHYQIFVDQYWFVTADKQVLKYKNMSFQTNKNIVIVEKMHNLYPSCTIELIPFICFEL